MVKQNSGRSGIDKEENISKIRHSASHILAHAVQNLYKDVKFGIGPAIEDGFYYDFEFSESVRITDDDLKRIEIEMHRLVDQDQMFIQSFKPVDEAIRHFEQKAQYYKAEIAKDLQENGEKKLSFYQNGEFIDLCAGPHVKSSKEILAFKLKAVAGAYWKGDENNKMLSRIYGYAFESKSEMDEYLTNIELAEERSHKKIGKEMKLFGIYDEIGQGLPVWLPDGYAIRIVLEEFLRNLDHEYNYFHIISPHIHRKELFEKSGHLNFYRESMYASMKIDEQEYYLKPMNCPAGMIVYSSEPRSYRDLPIKMGEFGTVYRYEKSGELNGLQRVRGFTQNDAHVFCRFEQLEETFLEVYEMLIKFYKAVGFDKYYFKLGLSDMSKEKYKFCGSFEGWKNAEDSLRKFVKKAGVDYVEKIGDAAFYGPKLDVQAVNVFGKEDSISTIQIDFNLPQRFGISYVDKDGQKKEPFVIHRALIGSYERFFAFLIEYYGGKFPLWFAPRQVKVISISEKYVDYANKIDDQLRKAGAEYNLWVRSDVDKSDSRLQSKIRDAEIMKYPYILIVGEKELKSNSVSVRVRGKGDVGIVSMDEFEKRFINDIKGKKIKLWN